MTHSIPRRILLTGAAALMLSITAQAQSSGPLRVILPVGAGSGVDTIMRAAQNELSKALGSQPVVIENLPGAGGTTAIVKAAPDGNTIGVVSNNHAVNPSVFKKLPYDSINDITPISVVGNTPFVLVVNPTRIPVQNAKELQAFLKAKPGAYNYASSGNGTIIHLAGAMFVDAAGVDVKHIPYKGVGPQIADLMGGQVEMGVVAVPAVQGQVKSGSLRAIGVMGKSRVASLPDVPTFAEQVFRKSTSPAGSPSSALPSCRRHRSNVCTMPSSQHLPAPRSRRRWPSRTTSSPDDAGSLAAVLQERAGALRPARQEDRHQARLTTSTLLETP